jgi:hypothetical protein
MQKHVLWIAAPRGMTAGVLALLPAAAGVQGADAIQGAAVGAIVALLIGMTAGLRWARQPSATTVVARPWTPSPSYEPAAPAAVPLPVERSAPAPRSVDPFASLDDLFPVLPTTSSRAPSPVDDITNPKRDEDIKPGSGFRW